MVIKLNVDFLAHSARTNWRLSLCILQPSVVARHRWRAFNQAAASRMYVMTVEGGTWLNCSLQSASPMHWGDQELSF